MEATSAQMKMENDWSWTGKNTFDWLPPLHSAEWTQSKCSDRSIQPSTFSLSSQMGKSAKCSIIQEAAGRVEVNFSIKDLMHAPIPKCQPIQVSRKNFACHGKKHLRRERWNKQAMNRIKIRYQRGWVRQVIRKWLFILVCAKTRLKAKSFFDDVNYSIILTYIFRLSWCTCAKFCGIETLLP